MTEQEAKKRIRNIVIKCNDYEYCKFGHDCTTGCVDAAKMAIKSLDAQIKLKEYIERLNQPEYNGIVWKKDEVVLLLKELLAE